MTVGVEGMGALDWLKAMRAEYWVEKCFWRLE